MTIDAVDAVKCKGEPLKPVEPPGADEWVEMLKRTRDVFGERVNGVEAQVS